MVRHRNHIRGDPSIHTQTTPEDNNIVPTEARQMNTEALKEWGRLLLIMGAYMGGFFLLLSIVLWLKTIVN